MASHPLRRIFEFVELALNVARTVTSQARASRHEDESLAWIPPSPKEAEPVTAPEPIGRGEFKSAPSPAPVAPLVLPSPSVQKMEELPIARSNGVGFEITLSTSFGGTSRSEVSIVGDRPVPSTKKPAGNEAEHWLPPGRAVDIGPYHIEGGLLYVGVGLPPLSRYERTEPALINPRLKVTLSAEQISLGYWLSYDQLQPGARAIYLAWLADGRKDPDIDIGYVFLYFYGLERRLLGPLVTGSPLSDDAPSIAAEIGRLLAIYSAHHSFNSYATNALALARLASGGMLDRLSCITAC